MTQNAREEPAMAVLTTGGLNNATDEVPPLHQGEALGEPGCHQNNWTTVHSRHRRRTWPGATLTATPRASNVVRPTGHQVWDTTHIPRNSQHHTRSEEFGDRATENVRAPCSRPSQTRTGIGRDRSMDPKAIPPHWSLLIRMVETNRQIGAEPSQMLRNNRTVM